MGRSYKMPLKFRKLKVNKSMHLYLLNLQREKYQVITVGLAQKN